MMKTVNAGTVVERFIPTIEEASLRKAEWEEGHKRVKVSMKLSGKSVGLKDYTFEITGIEGDYKIIRREDKPTESRYVN